MHHQRHDVGTAALLSGHRSTVRRCQPYPAGPQPRKLPVILSPEELARLLEAARTPKYKAALAIAYGAGLRISEIVSSKVVVVCIKLMPAAGQQSADSHL
jgi:integrase